MPTATADEQRVEFHTLSAGDYRVKSNFGLEIDLPTEDTRARRASAAGA
jgi:hypothetical protein